MSKEIKNIDDELYDEYQDLRIVEAQNLGMGLLNYLKDNDTIHLLHVRETQEEMERKNILAMHPYTIWQGKDGKWRTYLPDDEKGRRLIKKSTKKKIENSIIEYFKASQDDPTIHDVFTEWNDRRLELKQIVSGTKERYESDYDRFYSDFGKRKISSVTVNDFVDFIEEQIAKQSLTSSGFAKLRCITNGIISRASRRGLINYTKSDVMDRVETSEKNMKKPHKDDTHEVFNVKETSRMMEYLTKNTDIWNLGILLMFVTGLRVGELASLKWKYYSPDVIYVACTETRYKDENGNYVYDVKESPKTEAGYRPVVIPKAYHWIYDKLKELNPDSEFVFMRKGKRMHTTCFRDRLRRLCVKLDIVPKSVHKIRKTYCSILLDNHVDLNFIKRQMGHSDISVSENSYHRDRKELDQKIELVSDLPEFKVLSVA